MLRETEVDMLKTMSVTKRGQRRLTIENSTLYSKLPQIGKNVSRVLVHSYD